MKPFAITRTALGALPGLATTAMLLLLIVGVLLGLYEALRATWLLVFGGVHNVNFWLVALAQVALVAASICGAFLLARRRQPVAPWIFLLACVGGAFIAHVVLAAIVKPVWGTDYLKYWQHAQELVRRGEYGGFTNLYYSRSLFIPYPIVRLFGPEATYVLKLANIVILGGIQAFVYDILRRIRGHQAAQAGSLLLLAAPMPAYATLIPSHDLWGTFFVAAYAWLITLAISERPGRATPALSQISLAVLAGVIAYMAEVQRSIGLILLAALLITSLIHRFAFKHFTEREDMHRPANAVVLLALLCASGYFGADRLGTKLGLEPTGRQAYLMMKFAANSSGLTNGASDWAARFHDRFGEKRASAAEATDFALSVGLSSWALQPIDRIRHMAWQGSWLFSLNYPDGWNWMLRRPGGISEQTRTLLVLYAGLFAIGFTGVFIYALFRLATSRNLIPIPILTLLIAVLGLAFSLLALFSNKPSNLLPIWAVGPLVIGYVLAQREVEDVFGMSPSKWRLVANGIALILIAAMIVIGLLRVFYRAPEGRLLSGWTYDVVQRHLSLKNDELEDWQAALLGARPEAFDKWAYDPKTLASTYVDQAGRDGDRIRMYAGDTVTRMEFPANVVAGDRLELRTDVCRKRGQRDTVEFFLFSPYRPWVKHEATAPLTVSIDGNEVKRIKAPSRKNFRRFVVRNALPEGCHRLSFTMNVSKTHDGTPATSPVVEIWLPRLIE